jgi:hypothetical protein
MTEGGFLASFFLDKRLLKPHSHCLFEGEARGNLMIGQRRIRFLRDFTLSEREGVEMTRTGMFIGFDTTTALL